MEIASNWKDYEILDMSDGEKLEKWNNIILIRPDPQIIWIDIAEVILVVELGNIIRICQKLGKFIIKI